MAPSSRSIQFRQSQLDQLLRHPNGTVGQHLRHLGGAATKEANALADAELNRGTPPAGYHGGFESHVERGTRGLRMRLSNRSRVATYIEAGTRPHVIVAKRARVLAWKGADGGMHFAKRVMHPGTRAYRILERAMRKAVGRGR